MFRSKTYNYTFDLASGHFQRWGKTPEDDPTWSPFGPEILDIEISEGDGCPMTCAFCYKGNRKGDKAKNMSFATFKTVFDKLPHVVQNNKRIFFVTQIAFGITSVNSHPELFDIFDYCRSNSVIPNVTINGAEKLTDETVHRLADTCGAMSISINQTNAEQGFTLIKRLNDAGAMQINIHYVLSKQSADYAIDLVNFISNDPRLKKLNAVVFLGLKPKNRGENFDVLPTDDYVELVRFCLITGTRFGFDSCSAPKFDKSLEILNLTPEQKKMLASCSERCESGLFSAYIDCDGKYWHCSFGEGLEGRGGIDVVNCDNFHEKIWMNELVQKWRTELFSLNRECPLYPAIHVYPPNENKVPLNPITF